MNIFASPTALDFSAMKNQRTGCELYYPFERERLEGPSRKAWNSWPVLVMPKLDGDRCRRCPDEKVLLSSTEEIIYSMQHITDELNRLSPPFETDGELYRHGWEWAKINGIVSRTVNFSRESNLVEYHLFNVATDDAEQSQLKRTVELQKWFTENVSPGSPLKLVPTTPCYSHDQVMDCLNSFMALGYEGFIVHHAEAPYMRRRTTLGMKFKPKKRDDYTVIAVTEEQDKDGNGKDQLGCVTCTADSGDTFNVYSGFTADLRKQLWTIRDELPGRTLTVHYQSINPSGSPRSGVVVAREVKTKWELT